MTTKSNYNKTNGKQTKTRAMIQLQSTNNKQNKKHHHHHHQQQQEE